MLKNIHKIIGNQINHTLVPTTTENRAKQQKSKQNTGRLRNSAQKMQYVSVTESKFNIFIFIFQKLKTINTI